MTDGPVFELSAYYPILVFLFVLLGFAGSVLIVAHTVGPSSNTARKQVPYESGMDPIGDARQRFDIKFYLVAIMFLVFDVELLFLYPWAVVAYQTEPVPGGEAVRMIPLDLQRPVFWCVLAFVVLLLVGYLYDWKKGVFRWR